jgi:hypothetical protein
MAIEMDANQEKTEAMAEHYESVPYVKATRVYCPAGPGFRCSTWRP